MLTAPAACGFDAVSVDEGSVADDVVSEAASDDKQGTTTAGIRQRDIDTNSPGIDTNVAQSCGEIIQEQEPRVVPDVSVISIIIRPAGGS
jgi:hypothetical protein